MATGNQWNEFGRKSLGGLANLFTGIIQKGAKDDAKENYYEAMKNIREIMESAKKEFTIQPKQEDTQQEQPKDPLTDFLSGFNPQTPLEDNISSMQPGYTPEGPGIQQRTPQENTMVSLPPQDITTGTQGSVFDAYMEGLSKLAGNEYGAQYEPLLTAYYNSMQTKAPKYEYKEVGGTLVRVSEDGKVEPVYKSEPKENVSYDVPNDYRIVKDGENYYFEIPKLDKNKNTLEFIRTGEATEDEFLVYQNRMEIGKEKFSDLDRLNLKGSKLKGGSLKIPEINSTGEESQLLDEIQAYNKLKNIPWDKLTEQDQAKYQFLNEQITRKTGLNADEVAVDIATQRFKNKNKEFNQMESIRERQTALKNQMTDANSILQSFIDKYNNGEATAEQLQKGALKWYNDNLDALLPEIVPWVQEQLRLFGISI